ncbi:MAG: C4-dicarboxylate ABC transporter [Paraburkholderia sp.]|uniref:tellurite resistance/C4-dicarboxylate transporter family protein n=1 Tax=Paraburkholderia sp. TaxID=1926495 RepID=UPI0011FB912B|nr:tellurite resistance/C4-dicarboxylate transporter family protein [Paraburkholderia sp.]TAL92734.1 MAG: C4-dicarboxylate ABC transporter [Paraburkholderia sp.]
MSTLDPGQSWLREFPPTAFAMVMATGIVSIAAHLLGYDTVGWILLGINAVAWPVLLAITLCRLLRYPRAVHADIVDHGRGPGFLTLVAATAVLGSQLSAYRVLPQALPWLLGLAAGLWLVVAYTFLAAMTIGQRKPGLHAGLNGTWLLLVVATESIAVLATAVSSRHGASVPLDLLALAAWLLGGSLYMMLITLIFYRWCFVPMRAADLTEPWWINMGAMAITTFAGSRLILARHDLAGWPGDGQLVLLVLTTACWAMATFWIPLLAALFIEKHVIIGDPVYYTAAEWSVVFPLGMYSAATYAYAGAAHLPFLADVARITILIAFATWILAAIGLLRSAFRLAKGK